MSYNDSSLLAATSSHEELTSNYPDDISISMPMTSPLAEITRTFSNLDRIIGNSGGTDNALRDEWLVKQLHLQSPVYTEARGFKVVIGSWNVNSKLPDADCHLDEWLHFKQDPDIIAIGLQEIDMSAQAMIKGETDQCELWANALDGEVQNAKSKYHRLLARQMVGLCLCVYVKESLKDKVKQFKSDMIGLGAMGRMGNKGGVGARFQIFDTTFCFITSHLAPHMEGTAKRNQHFNDILSKLDFGGICAPDAHDYLFWFGDLNYRIDYEINEVKRLVKEKDYRTLMEYDQLTVEKFAGRVFWGFKEGQIHFAPTYKYDPGTLTFDTSEKERTPSYTDRILYKGKKRDKVKQVDYDSYELLSSDHLPVGSLFQCDVAMVVEHKFRACREKLIKEFDRVEVDENCPEIELGEQTLDFGPVRYDTPTTLTLKVKNIGTVVAEYVFVPKPSEDAPSQPWLRISSSTGLIIPGETAEIKITMLFDQYTGAHELNIDESGLNGDITDTLIVHVENGRDYFVQVNAEFQKTCFANSLANLIQCHEPIRIMQQQAAIKKLKAFGRKEDEAESPRVNAPPNLFLPKELWRLTDYIYKYGMRENGLFQETGDINEVALIRDMIDNGDSLEDYTGSIHSMTDALISFLESLEDPIIPTRYYRKCIENYLSASRIRKEVINKMPSVHYNVFQYLLSFLRELLLNSDANKLTPDQVAQGFANLIWRSPNNMPEEQKTLDRKKKMTLLKNFLKDEKRPSSKHSNKALFKNV
jgi:phosphatidylinositol-bisphosphatase